MTLLIAAVAIAYQLIALAACFARRAGGRATRHPKVSILKPVRGASLCFEEAMRSNAAQDYPEFELLCGFSDPRDRARPIVEQLATEYPRIRIIDSTTTAPNGKVGTLMDLERIATGDVILLSDADILVPGGYLERVIAPLEDPAIGLVTCAYRARSESAAGRFEALGIATDFAPSTLLAPWVGVDEFAMGSTIAVRRADLDRIGGLASVAAYLADDYQIGRRIRALGLRCVLSEVIVETHVGGGSWAAMWSHQVRWARTVRVSRFGGYLGLPVTFATLWALLLLALGQPLQALAVIAARMTMAVGAGAGVLGSRDVARWFWLIPVRDLFGVAVWVAGLYGNSVEWGGKRLELDPQGRIR